MALARYKDFCIDGVNAWKLTDFWARVLGLAGQHQDHGDGFATGPSDAHTVWVNQVPEAKTTKHRTHLDVVGWSPDALVELGATVLNRHQHGATMADPEGGEFCVFNPDAEPPYKLHSIVFDATDPGSAAQWWADLLGARCVHHQGWSSVEDPPGAPFAGLSFMPVPEPKTVKNRIHLDLWCDDLDGLARHGATLLRSRDTGLDWDVFADPEGNEFCAFARPV